MRFSPVATGRIQVACGCLASLFEKEAARTSWCFTGQHEGSARRKLLPAKNGAGEKRRWRKIVAGEKCSRRNWGEKSHRRNLRRQMHADKTAVEFYFGQEPILKWQNSGWFSRAPIAPSSLAAKNMPKFSHHRQPFACRLKNATAKSTTNFTTPYLPWPCPFCNKWFWAHCFQWLAIYWKKGKDPDPKTRFSIWTLLRTPGRFTTRPLPVYFTTKMSVVRPFSVLSKDELGPY